MCYIPRNVLVWQRSWFFIEVREFTEHDISRQPGALSFKFRLFQRHFSKRKCAYSKKDMLFECYLLAHISFIQVKLLI